VASCASKFSSTASRIPPPTSLAFMICAFFPSPRMKH